MLYQRDPQSFELRTAGTVIRLFLIELIFYLVVA